MASAAAYIVAPSHLITLHRHHATHGVSCHHQQERRQQQQHQQQQRRRRRMLLAAAAAAAAPASAQQQDAPPKTELRVCTGKVCTRQGSRQIASLGAQLGLPAVAVTTGGCLGACGSGPNAALLPAGEVLRHIATPADLAQVLRAFCGVDVDGPLLRATELRLAGNALALAGDLRGAIARYEEALAVGGGGDGGGGGGGGGAAAYMVYSNLSAAYLELKDAPAAIEAAREAVKRSPPGFHKAHVRLIDALYAARRFADAEAALADAVAADASFASLPEFKVIRRALDGAAGLGGGRPAARG